MHANDTKALTFFKNADTKLALIRIIEQIPSAIQSEEALSGFREGISSVFG